MATTLTYADAARFRTKEQGTTHYQAHPILSLSNGWMDAKHVFERVGDPLIAPPTYILDSVPPKEARTQAIRNAKTTKKHESAKENLQANPQERERAAGNPRQMSILDAAPRKHGRAETTRRVHSALHDKLSPNNPFACLEVEHGESLEESDSETSEADYQSCDASSGELIDRDGSTGGSGEETTSPAEDYANGIEGANEHSLSSQVAYYPYLDAYHDRSWRNNEDHLPRNPPPSPALVNEDLPVPLSPGSERGRAILELFRPSNPTPREATFGPFYVHYETNALTESSTCTEGFQRPLSVDLIESRMGGVPRLWKLMGWHDARV
ncbi:hypothetical protein PLEOSDRAFT_163980 [Pleurotus ostreatus PC15]|uniref:Uncharacterized protein n=1 Tax=Pleurotus ostreatus (strain PC15) TaxID=1137138 RepID=A0A067P1R7_PLEO1|nr:hypothetical protein PLEOSDRAFT_163980 [Pleurotus ostreatus PC15]